MEQFKIAIISAAFNDEITFHMHAEAKKVLLANGILEKNIINQEVPGSFELPIMAKVIAEAHQVDAIIALGAVIKGETAHFEYVSKAVTEGIMRVSLDMNIPITFGVLTTYTEEQARERAFDHNIAADWALGTIELICKIRAMRKAAPARG